MKKFLLCTLLFFSVTIHAQSKDESAIRQLLAKQASDWNRGDIEGYMQGYWKNDSLMFIGKSGITHGWTNTLKNYKRSYPDTTSMGKLELTIINLKKLSAEHFYVTGKWQLKRNIGNLEGFFTLLVRKIKKEWLIVADHSS